MAYLTALLLVISLFGIAAAINCTTNADCPQNQPNCVNGLCEGGCFPGDALVEMYNGGRKTMKELNIGDKVVVGKDSFSEVYAFGHKDSDVLSEFVQVKTEANTLELTSGHFVPVNIQGNAVYKRAGELKVGDIVSTKSVASPIREISKVEKLGLYSPLTISGNILVNDVEASVHSEWFFDSIFDVFGASQYLPSAYQAVLAPIRALYKIAGKELYSSGYAMLDSVVNVAEFGLKYGGDIALTVGLGALAIASKAL